MIPIKKWLIVGLVALAALAACAPATPTPGETAIPTVITPRTVILSAFAYKDAAGAWQGESAPFIKLLSEPVDRSATMPACQMVWEGRLYNQPVAVVTMGTGKVATAICMDALLQAYDGAAGIKAVVWSGIAGITPMFGGTVTADGQRRSGQPTVIGDVCTAFVAKDYDLQFSSFADGTWWDFSWPNAADVAVGSLPLAQELYQAGLSASWPDVPSGPAANTAKYNGPAAVRKATAFPPDQCGEITGDNFWHGAVEDARARTMMAAALSKALGQEISPDEIVVLTAMEGTGWGNALEAYAQATGQTIPWAISRSASNFDQPWFTDDTASTSFAVTAQQSIEAGMESGGGGAYGSVTAAVPVLRWLELQNK